MSAEILLDHTFPHGTPDGYLKGCRGSHCPGAMSCSDVNVRYQGDYGFRKQIDAGLAVVDILERDRQAAVAAAEAKRAAVREAAKARHNESRRSARGATPRKVRVPGVAKEPTTDLQIAVHKFHGQGLTDALISERIGMTRTQVKAVRLYLNLPPHHKPTAEADIRAMHAQGLSDTEIAKRLNMHPRYIRDRLRHFGLHPTPTLATAGVSSFRRAHDGRL